VQDFGLDRKQIGLDGDDPTQPPQQGCQAQHEFAFDRRLGIVVRDDRGLLLVVRSALALGSNQRIGMRTYPVAPTHAMKVVHTHQDAAAQWLREKRDVADCCRAGEHSQRPVLVAFAGSPAVLPASDARPRRRGAFALNLESVDTGRQFDSFALDSASRAG
jgi:hypothetical protein